MICVTPVLIISYSYFEKMLVSTLSAPRILISEERTPIEFAARLLGGGGGEDLHNNYWSKSSFCFRLQ